MKYKQLGNTGLKVSEICMSFLPVHEEGLDVLPWSSLEGSFLTGKYRRDQEGTEGARRTDFDFPAVDKE